MLEPRLLLSFSAPQAFPIAGGAFAVAAGDFNGDHKVDLIAPAGLGGASVVLGNGDGTFSPPKNSFTTPVAGGIANGVAVGDFNRDGKLDAAVTNSSGYLSVLLGNGDGTFRAPSSTFVAPGLSSVAVGDFNGDGKADLEVVNPGSNKQPGTTAMFLFGNGDGTFSGPVQVGVGNGPIVAATGDFNADGKLDAVAANFKDGTVSLLLGNGNGTFQGLRNFGVGTHPVSLAVGDINGDGKLDIVAGLAGGSVNFLYGKGDGSFSGGKKIDLSLAVNSVALADVNGDGKQDVIAANNQANTLSVLPGNGDGTFQNPVNYAAGNQPWSIVTGDFNGDRLADIASTEIGSGDVTVFVSHPAGTFVAPTGFAAGSQPSDIARADFNGDGKLDLVAANAYSENVSVLLGNGTGSFQSAGSYATGGQASKVVSGDFNGDGRVDLAVSNWSSNAAVPGSVAILLGNGDGTFQAAVNYGAGLDPYGLQAADFNHDGKIDLAVADNNFNNGNPGAPGQSNVSVLLGNGDGTFQAPRGFDTAGAHPLNVAVSDFNGDGNLDLAVTSTNYAGTTNAVTVLLGNGNGTFQSPFVVMAGAIANSIAAADLNGDGKADLVVTTGSGTTLFVGNGDGTFGTATLISNVGWASLVVGDMNGDGKPDIAVANGFEVSVMLNNGDGTFAIPSNYLVGNPVNALVIGDFDGDGRIDLAAANSPFGSPGTVLILRNAG